MLHVQSVAIDDEKPLHSHSYAMSVKPDALQQLARKLSFWKPLSSQLLGLNKVDVKEVEAG